MANLRNYQIASNSSLDWHQTCIMVQTYIYKGKTEPNCTWRDKIDIKISE